MNERKQVRKKSNTFSLSTATTKFITRQQKGQRGGTTLHRETNGTATSCMLYQGQVFPGVQLAIGTILARRCRRGRRAGGSHVSGEVVDCACPEIVTPHFQASESVCVLAL